MASELIKDLDILVPDQKHVKFGGREWVLPGDLPLETFLRANRIAQEEDQADREADDAGAKALGRIESMVDNVVSLFTWELEDRNTPEQIETVREEVRRIALRRGLRYIVRLIDEIYREDAQKDDVIEGEARAVEAAPPVEEPNGTTSSSGSPVQTTPTPSRQEIPAAAS